MTSDWIIHLNFLSNFLIFHPIFSLCSCRVNNDIFFQILNDWQLRMAGLMLLSTLFNSCNESEQLLCQHSSFLAAWVDFEIWRTYEADFTSSNSSFLFSMTWFDSWTLAMSPSSSSLKPNRANKPPKYKMTEETNVKENCNVFHSDDAITSLRR